ncbi:hypothetical protein IFM46972_06293 [Aspergillus udagawae]|uniref:Uncharacterized protein n=1 Tax=Aspergillus udagawae TaxID=91492 RepID=A0A8H3P2X1_9EURO|nr:hypothetical protein IFM46972_06293 [Aspergillus udagawae]
MESAPLNPAVRHRPQKIFYPDLILRLQWKLAINRVLTRRGFKHIYIHKKTGGLYKDKDITKDIRWEELANRITLWLRSGGGFLW